MELNKIKTYVNFAKRSKNILYGTDDILKSNNVQFVLISNDLSDLAKIKLQKYLENNEISYNYLTNMQIFEICEKNSVKAFAITDKNLANAIKVNLLTNVSDGGNLE